MDFNWKTFKDIFVILEKIFLMAYHNGGDLILLLEFLEVGIELVIWFPTILLIITFVLNFQMKNVITI